MATNIFNYLHNIFSMIFMKYFLSLTVGTPLKYWQACKKLNLGDKLHFMKIIRNISWKSSKLFHENHWEYFRSVVSPPQWRGVREVGVLAVCEGGRRQYSCGVWAQLCEDARTGKTTGPRPHLLSQDTSQASPVTTLIDFPCMEPTYHYAMSDSDRQEMPLT